MTAPPDKVTPTEELAIQLWYTYATERGDIERTLDWLRGANPVAIGAMGWIRMAPHEKDVWLAVAEKAQKLLGSVDV